MEHRIHTPSSPLIQAVSRFSKAFALVLRPAGSEEARGSVGQETYSSCKAGQTARRRVNPSQPRSAAQLAVRASMTTVSRAWASLSAGERTGWNAYAAAHPVSNVFGQQTTLSGFNWFCRLTRNLAEANIAQVDTAPSTSAPAAISGLAATGSEGELSLAWTAAGLSAFKIGVWLYGPHSAGIAAKEEMASLWAYQPAETSPLVISDLSAGLYHVYAYLMEEASGLIGPTSSDDFTVT